MNKKVKLKIIHMYVCIVYKFYTEYKMRNKYIEHFLFDWNGEGEYHFLKWQIY